MHSLSRVFVTLLATSARAGGLSVQLKDGSTHNLAAVLCLDDPLAGRAEHEVALHDAACRVRIPTAA